MAMNLLPFFAFSAALLFMLLLYLVWVRFFDSRHKAKNQRLQAIHDVVHPEGERPGTQAGRQVLVPETWLRSRSRTFVRLENLLQCSHSQLTARQLAGLMLTLFTGVVALGLLRHAHPVILLVPAVAIAATPVLWLSRQAGRIRKAFGDKLPEALDYLSRALRAGHSLTSAIGMVGKEFPDPIGKEFKTVFDEIGFGIPFKDALGQFADRFQCNDVNFFVISLKIQHETGGNLTELLDGLAKTMRDRVKLRGKIRTLSSEGRTSALVLGSMPFILAGILSLINPGYISVLWRTSQGQTLMLIGGGLIAVGFFVLSRIVQIKV